MRERLYDGACLLLSKSETGSKGEFLEPSKEVDFATAAPIPERGQEPAQAARPTRTSLELQHKPLHTNVFHSCTETLSVLHYLDAGAKRE